LYDDSVQTITLSGTLRPNRINFNTSNIAITGNNTVTSQGTSAVAIGVFAGFADQGDRAVAIGCNAGNTVQGSDSVGIGIYAGYNTQQSYAVAIGPNAGNDNQGASAVAIGRNAGYNYQGINAVAIGRQAGMYNQGANSIILNATGSDLDQTTANTFTVAPIRNDDSQTQALCYNTSTKEITYSTTGTKTFVIDHPLDDAKYLIHACLEGPEAGVYYRGTAFISPTDKYVELTLPAYVDSLARDFTIHLTPVITSNPEDDFECINNPILVSSRVIKGKFRVYMNNRTTSSSCFFDYIVFGKRCSIEVERKKTEVEVKGFGPYAWI
jgi:hypothetical protein